jgi:HPt (histidine-containing phosphotransfer) domain-containing protein
MLIDSEELLEEVEDDREMLGAMFTLFQQDAEERLPKIRGAIGSANATVQMEEAHALKGGVGNFFAMSVYETAYQLEIMGRDGQLADAPSVLAELEKQLADMNAEISNIVAG